MNPITPDEIICKCDVCECEMTAADVDQIPADKFDEDAPVCAECRKTVCCVRECDECYEKAPCSEMCLCQTCGDSWMCKDCVHRAEDKAPICQDCLDLQEEEEEEEK